jgi:hypothetical protein
VGLVETWVEERSWRKIEKLLPKEYKWECQWGKRGKKNGRAAAGIITGVKLGIKEKRQEKGEEEECMERNIHIGKKHRCRRYNNRKQRKMYSHGTRLQLENTRKRSKKRMDEREMEEDGKNRKRWGIGIKMFFFLKCYFMFKEKCNQESESA